MEKKNKTKQNKLTYLNVQSKKEKNLKCDGTVRYPGGIFQREYKKHGHEANKMKWTK